MKDLEQGLARAIRHFWRVRRRQAKNQGGATGRKDYGERGAVTGGRQLDGIVGLVCDLLVEAGIPDASVIRRSSVVLPGYFRPTKEWDLLVIVEHRLLAAIEFKSQVGPSFGNNYNNRTEEALGSATDILTAYREGAFQPSEKPWLGYLMILEETKRSVSPVKVDEPFFKVFEEFRGASYAKRYELLCLKGKRTSLRCRLFSHDDSRWRGQRRISRAFSGTDLSKFHGVTDREGGGLCQAAPPAVINEGSLEV